MPNIPNRKPIIKSFQFNIEWVLYEDDDIIVANKPSGLLSVPGRGDDRKESLITHIEHYCGEAYIVHRLDMDTSGIMVIAKHKAAHRALSMQFQNRQTQKEYRAICYGLPSQTQGVMQQPMRCDWENRPRQMVDPIHGKHATTHWQIEQTLTLANTKQTGSHFATLVKLTPITGRTHQLRLHLKMLGHPILGDNLYADDFSLSSSSRLLLHAAQLCFTHPTTGQPFSIACPIDLSDYLQCNDR